MFLTSIHQSRCLVLKETVTNLFKVRSLKILNTQYQDSLPGSKVATEPLPGSSKNIEPVTTIDRPQTDNLLLSPDKIAKIKDEKAASANVSENKNMYKELEQKLKNISENQIIAEEKSCSSAVWAPNKPKVELQVTKKTEHAVSFEEVPGPTSLKVVSNMMKNIPVIGMQTIYCVLQGLNHLVLSYGNQKVWTRNIKPFNLLFDKYGDIVCLRIPFCGEIVLVQKPEHISAIYKQRNLNNVTFSNFDSLTEWHKGQAKRHFDVGLSLTQEIKDIFKENYEAKKIFWSNAKYHNTVEKTSDEFIKRIFAIRNIHDEVPNDFHNELYTWGIECMMQTLFGTNLGFYSVGDMQTNLEAQRTLKSFIDASDALQQCESGMQLWRVFNTRSWEKLTNSCETLENILAKHIRMSKLRLDIALKMMMENKDVKETSEIIKSSLVKALILSGCVQPEQILTLCMDMMIIGVNAVSISLGFIFYHLAKSPKKQLQLFNEICKVLPQKNSVLKLEDLDKTPYLHACVTESLRLKHPIPYSVMQLSSSIILNKYFIPAGTFVMTANEISCMKEENFDEAERFKPERWLDDNATSLQDVVIPLSEGTRSFLGRDWLHQQLAVATAKVVRNFNLSYNYGEIKTNRKIISKPNKPFKFTFEERTI